MCCGGDGRRGSAGGDLLLRRRRHGRHDAVPTGALGAVARVGEVSSRADERECGSRHAGLARHARRPGGRGRPLRGERTGRGFAACSAASLLAGLVVVALPYDAPPREATVRGGGRELLQGFATIAADRRLGLITVLGLVQTFTRGCLTVFAVVVAIDLLDTGDPGVGVLNAAVGAGGLLGSIFAFRLVRGGGLARWFGVGIALFGAPLTLVGVVPEQAAAIVLLGLVGVGNALIDVGGLTMLARLADETALARRRWSATDALSRCSDAAAASARSPCCATSREQPPFAHPRMQTCA